MEEPLNFPTTEEVKAVVLARSRLITLDDIATACNVSVSWIKQVLKGEIKKPSLDSMREMYLYVKKIENDQQ